MTTTARQNGYAPHTPAAPGFGSALRTHRERAHLSQSELARMTGQDHSMLSRLESGGRNPSRDTVLALSEALGLSVVERAGLMAAARLLPDEVTAGEVVALVMAKEGVRTS